MREPLGFGLFPSGDSVLLASLLIAIHRTHACVLATCFSQVFSAVLIGQLGLKVQAGGEAVGSEAVTDISPKPDDGADLGLDAQKAIGLVGGELRPAFGKGVAQRGGTALQTIPFSL